MKLHSKLKKDRAKELENIVNNINNARKSKMDKPFVGFSLSEKRAALKQLGMPVNICIKAF